MSLTGGKRKVNKSLKAWVAFVKKVQKEEKISYKDAIHRAKQRKDKGEKWMTGGYSETVAMETIPQPTPAILSTTPPTTGAPTDTEGLSGVATLFDEDAAQNNLNAAGDDLAASEDAMGAAVVESMGGRKRRTMRRARGRGKARTARKSRGRGKGRSRGRSSRKN